MKKWALLISGIVEVSGAIILYFNPNLIFQSDIPIFLIYKLYALTLFVVGLISLLTARHYREDDYSRHIFLCMMFLHAAVSMMTYTANYDELVQPLQASITHGILFILFVFAYLSDIKKD
ncbi:hypothetical protein N9L92_03600 [Saprospiraceae bacterium]|nr:hypothetical protein [Saprospiraceae bacterium]